VSINATTPRAHYAIELGRCGFTLKVRHKIMHCLEKWRE